MKTDIDMDIDRQTNSRPCERDRQTYRPRKTCIDSNRQRWTDSRERKGQISRA